MTASHPLYSEGCCSSFILSALREVVVWIETCIKHIFISFFTAKVLKEVERLNGSAQTFFFKHVRIGVFLLSGFFRLLKLLFLNRLH